MGGHSHNPTAGTQNQGNSLGDRSCVRQSKLYRMYESGNDVKSILGTSHLCWDANQKQGAYQGHDVYDHTKDDPLGVHDAFTNTEKYSRKSSNDAAYGKRSDGRGVGNFLTGYTEGTNTDYRRGPVAGKNEPPKRPSVGGRQDHDDYDDYNPRSRNARGSFANDENNYRNSSYGGQDERSYPSKRRDDDRSYNNYSNERRSGGYDDHNSTNDRYRNMKGDVDSSLSNYQSKRSQHAEPPAPQERTAVRVFKQEKSTCPW